MNWAGAPWTLHFLTSRSTFHFSLFTFHFPQGPLFTFHSSLFTSLGDHFSLFTLHFSLPLGTLFTYFTQCGAMAIAACSVGHRSALHRALQRAAFFQASFCAIGGMRFPPLSRKLGVRCTACFGMMADAESGLMNSAGASFSCPLAGMLERIFVNLQAGRTGGAIYVALREDDIGSLIYK